MYAEEGTWAHELCEYKVKKYLHERKKRPQSDFFTEEIEQATDVYAEFVISIIEGMKRNGVEPLCFVEERLDFSNIVPEGFGTGDMIILGKDEQGRGLLHICDYKNGKGVFVDAHENSQMMLYATGALNAYGYIYEIETVRMSIIQPRLENISTYEMSVADLRAWGDSIRPSLRWPLRVKVSSIRGTGAGSAGQRQSAKPAWRKRWRLPGRSSLTWTEGRWRTRRKKQMPQRRITPTHPLLYSNHRGL